MYKDYKFWFIRRDDNGFIIEAGINFYQGQYQKIKNDKGIEKDVYVRNRKLSDNDLFNLNAQLIKRLDGTFSVRYTALNFGSIKTDDELRLFLNEQLAKIKGREAIAEQNG